MLTQTVSKCPKPLEGQLYANIIVAGGNTNLKGFKDRLAHDLESVKPYDSTVRIFEL